MANNTLDEVEPAGRVVAKKYRVVRALGAGGMGAVYEAENTWTHRRVALKVMNPEVSKSEAFVQRFMREARTAASLDHPNVVDVLDMGQDERTGELFIVQQLLVGRDLAAHLKARGRLPVEDAVRWIAPVMEALVVAHARGVIHRDLKPDNIFLAETARGQVPTLIDFGIAKVVSDASTQKTGTGVLIGTPSYMSPEQGRGDTSLDARSDVWSLGVVLYEVLSGELPFEAANPNALIAKIIYEAPRPLAAAAPDLPAAVVAAVMGALEPDLARRFPSMQVFLDALRAAAGSAPVPLGLETTMPSVPPASSGTQVMAAKPVPPSHSTLTPQTVPARSAPRNLRIAASLGVAVLLLAAVAMVARPAPVARPAASSAPVVRAPAEATPVVPAALPEVVAPPVPPPRASAVVAPPGADEPAPLPVAARRSARRGTASRRVARPAPAAPSSIPLD